MSVGFGLRSPAHADVATSTSCILDVKLLSKPVGQLLRNKACDHVSLTTRRERNDHSHRPHWIALRHPQTRTSGHSRTADQQIQETPTWKDHGILPEGRLSLAQSTGQGEPGQRARNNSSL